MISDKYIVRVGTHAKVRLVRTYAVDVILRRNDEGSVTVRSRFLRRQVLAATDPSSFLLRMTSKSIRPRRWASGGTPVSRRDLADGRHTGAAVTDTICQKHSYK